MEWIFDMETKVFSRINNKISSKLKKLYPQIKVTMESQSETPSTFPTIYLHFLGGLEQGENLSGKYINAVLTTIQFEIIVNKSYTLADARKITTEVLKILKELRFSITSLPEKQSVTSNTIRMVGRARRLIGSQDILG